MDVLQGNIADFYTFQDACGASSAVLEASDGTNKVTEVVNFNVICFPDAPDFFEDDPRNNSIQDNSTVNFEFSVFDPDPNEDLFVEFFHGDTPTPASALNFTIHGGPFGIDEDVDFDVSGLEDGKTYYWFVELSSGSITVVSNLFQYTVEINDNPTINSYSPTDDVVEL